MILTVTLNPAIDYHYVVPDIKIDIPLRSTAEEKSAGGKGVNVSIVAKELGAETTALMFTGGNTGSEFLHLLTKKNIKTANIPIAGETRINFVITDSGDNRRIKVNSPGPEISMADIDKLLRHYKKLLSKVKIVVLSGKIPLGIDPGIYAEFIDAAKKKNVKVILDAEGDTLKTGIKSCPFMIKPNKQELESILNYKINDKDSLIKAGREIIMSGVELVVISDGENECYAITNKKILSARPPVVSPLHAVGSGDSLVAGIAVELLKGSSIAQALKTGVACGTASAMTPYPGLFDHAVYRKIIRRVNVVRIV